METFNVKAVRLFQKGCCLFYQEGQFERALQVWQQAIQIYQKNKDLEAEANLHIQLVSILNSGGYYEYALPCAGRALDLSRILGERRSEAMMLYNMGVTFNGLNEFDTSLEYMNQALSVFREIGDRNGEAITLHYIGVLYSWKGEPHREVNYYLQALPVFHAVGDRRNEADVRCDIAMSYQKFNNLPLALEHIDSAIAIVENLLTGETDETVRASYLKMNQNYLNIRSKLLKQMNP